MWALGGGLHRDDAAGNDPCRSTTAGSESRSEGSLGDQNKLKQPATRTQKPEKLKKSGFCVRACKSYLFCTILAMMIGCTAAYEPRGLVECGPARPEEAPFLPVSPELDSNSQGLSMLNMSLTCSFGLSMLLYILRWEDVLYRLWACRPDRDPISCRKAGCMRLKGPRFGWRRRFAERLRLRSRPKCRFCQRLGSVKSVARSHVPLNGLLRGGGKGKCEDHETSLLVELSKFLEKFKVAAAKQPPRQDKDSALLHALTKLLERARKNPVGLLDRVEKLVKLAREVDLKKPATVDAADAGAAHATVKVDAGSKGTKGKGKGKQQSSVDSTKPKSQKQSPVVEMESTCWGGRLNKWTDVVAALEKGQVPKGQATHCPSLSRALEARALAKAHALRLEFACCVEYIDTLEWPADAKVVLLPFRVDGNLVFRKCALLQLGDKMPSLPEHLVYQLPQQHAPVHKDLVTLRLHLPKVFVSEERWKSFKARPVDGVKEWLGKLRMHSTYGWREHKQKNWKGEDETFLSGYVKIQESVVSDLLSLSGRHGLFAARLANEQACRSNVCWLERGDRSFAAYYSFALDESKRQNSPVAFRVGGGNNLGLRLQASEAARSVGVWRVSGVPFGWSDEELVKVLTTAAWENVEVIALPRFRKQPWLIRAKPPKSFVGVVGAVHVEEELLLLQRAAQRKPKDASSSRLNLSVQRPSSHVALKPDEVAETQIDEAGDVLMTERPEEQAALSGLEETKAHDEAGAGKRASSPKPANVAKKLNLACLPRRNVSLTQSLKSWTPCRMDRVATLPLRLALL